MTKTIYRLRVEINPMVSSGAEPMMKKAEFHLETKDLAWTKLRTAHESKLGYNRETKTKTIFTIDAVDMEEEDEHK